MKKTIRFSLALLVFSSIAANADPFYVTTGDGRILNFTAPDTYTVYASGLNDPAGLALDNFGNLYEANTGSNQIFKFTGPNTYTVYASGLHPFGLALDTAGNLYEADSALGQILKFTAPNTYSVFASGLNYPISIAVDNSQNVYVSDGGTGQILKYTAPNTATVFASGLSTPRGLAIDASGRLYVAEDTSNGTIRQFTAPNTSTVYAGGLINPFGLAFDSAGNLFVGQPTTISKFTAPNTSTVYASGLFYPNNFAFAGTRYAVPLPTSAPSISNLPTHDANFFTGLQSTLQNHGSDFSPETYASLNNNAQSTAAIIDPNSPNFLKANGVRIADALSLVSSAVDSAASLVRPASAMERIFTLSMSAASQLHVFPDDVQTQLDSYSFAFGALRELDTVDNINPISLLVSANTYIYGTILANQLKTYGQDPPDPNFQSVYLANVVMSSSLPTTGNAQLDIALRNALGASAKASAYLKAVNASFDKYAGAVDAGDNIHAALQLEAILNYLKLYNEAAQDAALQLKQTQSLMTSLGLAGGTYDPQTLIDLQSQITANGLPSDITNVLTQLGLTSNQMYQVKQSILGMDPNAISGTFADASNMASITLLQGTTAAVPEPSSWAMLAMGAGSILAFRYRRGRA